MTLRWVLCALLLWLPVHADQGFENDEEDGKIYTNTWAVRLNAHDESVADEVAVSLGFENRGGTASLPGYFTFVHRQTEDRQKRSAEHHTQPLLAHPRVKWAKQQTQLFRFKRGFEALERKSERLARVQKNIEYFDDPEWPKQWYLYDSGFTEASGNLGVLEATERGYTGKGVVVSIIDDGLDHRHPDLKENYDPMASIDVNDNDFDPLPDASTPTKIIENAHGTKCGGEVAAAADNGVCGVGVANQASIGGIRMLDGTITDVVEANALGFNCNYIHIKSASWGPKDDGKTFGRPEKLGTNAMKNCALQGRQGKGTIYVWATGNGGSYLDNCNCDGYTSSIYTLSVGSISPGGFCTFYDEKCPSTMAVVYTGDVGENKRENYANLVTTSLWLENHDDGCVDSFSGTSCAAPLAAGIVALVLEANPELTWRDMQHLVVETARKNDPQSVTWKRNAAGHNYSLCYGFGVLNAMDMINKAKDWELVGEQLTHEVPGQLTPETRKIPSNGVLTLKLRNDDAIIKKLEHVQFMLSTSHRRRGDMVIELTSPQGTTSQLLAKRPIDDSTDGLDKWPFTSVEFWGENPRGEWTMEIKDDKSENSFSPRKNQDILFDEETSTQSDEPILNDLTHGRFKEDYMKLAKRSKEELFQQSDEPNFTRELQHGRFKEDYMKLRADSTEPRNVESDESVCSPSEDLEGPVAGCVTEFSLITYGTA